jgi:phosphomannomutase
MQLSRSLLETWTANPEAFKKDLGMGGIPHSSVDMTDGMRMSFADDSIVHVRPSGNAPELRCYAEAENMARAGDIVRRSLELLHRILA